MPQHAIGSRNKAMGVDGESFGGDRGREKFASAGVLEGMGEEPETGNYKAVMAEKCRTKAAECAAQAEVLRDPRAKAAWLEMANDWRALAAQIEATRW